jgi:hypothetical protein
MAAFVWAQSEPDVVDFLKSTAGALANAHDPYGDGRPDAQAFLEKFDPAMPGFAALRDQIDALVARAEVGTAIEVVTDEGDDHKRELQLDWVLEITDQRPRRQIVKCTIERVKGAWKFTALDPIDFFRY